MLTKRSEKLALGIALTLFLVCCIVSISFASTGMERLERFLSFTLLPLAIVMGLRRLRLYREDKTPNSNFER